MKLYGLDKSKQKFLTFLEESRDNQDCIKKKTIKIQTLGKTNVAKKMQSFANLYAEFKEMYFSHFSIFNFNQSFLK